MKKLSLFIIMIFSISSVKATYKYTEWSNEYPKGVEEYLIESEVRYKWYKESIVNIEYLPRHLFENKKVDLLNYDEGTPSEYSIYSPEILRDRKIESKIEYYTFDEEDVDHITLRNFNFNGYVEFSEIYIYDKRTNNKIDYKLEEYYSNTYGTGYLNDGNDNNGDIISNYFKISMYLKSNVTPDNLKVVIKYKSPIEYNNVFFNTFSNGIFNHIYEKSITLPICEKKGFCDLVLEYDDTYIPNLYQRIKLYSFTDKLYYTYEIDTKYLDGYRAYNDDYFNDGYVYDENDTVTYYRYIDDCYVNFDAWGNFIDTDSTYCYKNYCYSEYVKHIEEEIKEPLIDDVIAEEVMSPQTTDKIVDDIVIGIVSLIILILLLYFKKYLEKCHMNKKSTFVEINNLD